MAKAEDIDRTAVLQATDRHGVAWLVLGCAILFLAPAAFAPRHGDPTPYETPVNYALVASPPSASGDEDARLPAVMDETGATPASATAEKPATPQQHAVEAAPFHVKHDQYYCGFLAQAMIGNITPEQIARREQTSGVIMGGVGGALLGALFGGSGGHSGASATVGAGAGLLAGAAMGSSSAHRASDDLRGRYDAAYTWCMNQKDDVPAKAQARS